MALRAPELIIFILMAYLMLFPTEQVPLNSPAFLPFICLTLSVHSLSVNSKLKVASSRHQDSRSSPTGTLSLNCWKECHEKRKVSDSHPTRSEGRAQRSSHSSVPGWSHCYLVDKAEQMAAAQSRSLREWVNSQFSYLAAAISPKGMLPSIKG